MATIATLVALGLLSALVGWIVFQGLGVLGTQLSGDPPLVSYWKRIHQYVTQHEIYYEIAFDAGISLLGLLLVGLVIFVPRLLRRFANDPDNESNLNAVKETLVIVRVLATIILVTAIIVFPQLPADWTKRYVDSAFKNGADEVKTTFFGMVEAEYKNPIFQQKVTGGVAALLSSDLKPPLTPEQVQQVSAFLASNLPQVATVVAQNKETEAAPPPATGEGPYGIVVSADTKRDLAAYEVTLLRREKFPPTAIHVYRRQGFLRTVVNFPKREDAVNSLKPILKDRPTAYLINVKKWCVTSMPSTEPPIAGVTVEACS